MNPLGDARKCLEKNSKSKDTNAQMVKIPSYEGDMSILQNHIPIITFLRPGIIKVEKNNAKLEEFFVQDGTIEFFNNNLVVLSTSVLSVKDISKEFLDDLNQETSKNDIYYDLKTTFDSYVQLLESAKKNKIKCPIWFA